MAFRFRPFLVWSLLHLLCRLFYLLTSAQQRCRENRILTEAVYDIIRVVCGLDQWQAKVLSTVLVYLAFLRSGMYTREEISRQKQAFWTAFGRYMQPVLSAEGLPVTWLNYKTGMSGISFKMDADRYQAIIMILLSHSDAAIRQAHYDRFLQLKGMLEEALGEDDWTWKPPEMETAGEKTCSISKTLKGVNVLNQADWPSIISFLKPRIIALDQFWNMAKYSFENT